MKTKIYVFLLLIFISGCSSSLFELSSVDTNYDYYKGRQILVKEDSSAAVFLNFEEQEESFFIFYVEVVNKSNSPFEINPAKINMQILESKSNELTESISFYALDPEVQIEVLNKNQQSLATSHAVTQGLFGLFAVAEIVSDIADEESDEAVYDAAKWGAVIHAEEIDHEIENEQIENEKYYWQNEVLRKTTLYKGDRFGGIFYIQFDEDAELIKITVPLGNSEYEFLFEQREI